MNPDLLDKMLKSRAKHPKNKKYLSGFEDGAEAILDYLTEENKNLTDTWKAYR